MSITILIFAMTQLFSYVSVEVNADSPSNTSSRLCQMNITFMLHLDTLQRKSHLNPIISLLQTEHNIFAIGIYYDTSFLWVNIKKIFEL